MSEQAHLSDLIITLSRDKVMLDLSGLPEEGRTHWKTTFNVEGLFLEEKISRSLDEVLLQNPVLIDHFSCVDVVVIDRPHVAIPKHYIQQHQAATIAAKYLRLRAGDSLSSDVTSNGTAMCYTLPVSTVFMLKEYYSNIHITHISSLVWQYLSANQQAQNASVTYYCVLHHTLVVLSAENDKLIFSKNFNITDDSDALYYALACRRLLKSKQHVLINIDQEKNEVELYEDSALKIDSSMTLPSLHILLSQHKACVS